LTRRTRYTATRIAIVRAAITIVIETVANFSAGVLVAIANDCSRRARRGACRAYTLLTGTAGQPAARITIVDGAIAIVVNTVTRFRRREHRLCTDDHAGGARGNACGANALKTGIAGYAAAGIAIIDRTIAIVV
jgi:hypothetical protein